jgi:hypothetical protein
MEITWNNYADKMPPDDSTLVIIGYGEPELYKLENGNDSHLLVLAKHSFNNRRWTEYTQEKWEALHENRS